jgi:hypothetical protein
LVGYIFTPIFFRSRSGALAGSKLSTFPPPTRAAARRVNTYWMSMTPTLPWCFGSQRSLKMMKPNSAAATRPGRMSGSVMRRNVAHGVAPRESAASSTERSSPARLAVTRRTVHGIVMRT